MPFFFDMREISSHEYFRMARGIQELVHHDASAPVRLHAQQFTQRRGLHTSSPQSDNRVDALIAHHNVARLHVGDMRVGVHFNVEALQLLNRLG